MYHCASLSCTSSHQFELNSSSPWVYHAKSMFTKYIVSWYRFNELPTKNLTYFEVRTVVDTKVVHSRVGPFLITHHLFGKWVTFVGNGKRVRGQQEQHEDTHTNSCGWSHHDGTQHDQRCAHANQRAIGGTAGGSGNGNWLSCGGLGSCASGERSLFDQTTLVPQLVLHLTKVVDNCQSRRWLSGNDFHVFFSLRNYNAMLETTR